MKPELRDHRTSRPGFTLLEVMVSLAIGALLIGAVTGLISQALRYRTSLKEKANVQPILESAAEIILADPRKATQGVVRLTELEGAPAVAVRLAPVPLPSSVGKSSNGTLYRVMLSYKSSDLEFSVILPAAKGS
ncbi:MAG: prepilin-type N-terminal cleavage/methylation domain-containing protein [Syntrophobacteraceae bacterium]|nr:prepilin-type N-terminal cleavage/methylation domain-containing protein [Syntrophobacteraceae bacterium]